MYPLRLQHPEHGYHYVYNSFEEEAHRAIGWGDEDAAPQAKQEPTTSQATPAPAGAAPKRRGRKPKQ